MKWQKVIYYTDKLTCLRFYHKMVPSDENNLKTIKLCSFLKTERINGSGILS
jgi:hypothetical protein